MGSLLDGFEAARNARDERSAEHHRLQEKVDGNLAELGRLLDQDADLMQKYEISHHVSNRVLQVTHRRSPIISIHYDPTPNQFRLVYMRDNSNILATSAEDCVKAIGGLVFSITTRE